MKNSKVVVTGGAGFIGSNLAHTLAADNTVIIIDDLSLGRMENIADIIERENVTFIKGSILDFPMLQEAFQGVDYIFHQAALPSVPRSIEDPQATNEVNITGTLNVFVAARDCHAKKVVFASSSSVYGDTPVLPKVEDMPSNPQSPYALTKMVGEYYGQVFGSIYQLPVICLRYFNIYGPRQTPNSQYAAVIPMFITRIKKGEPPVVYGDGEQTRDFTYIKDCVQANIVAAESNAAGVINVGAGSKITLNALIEATTRLLNSDVQPIYRESRVGDVRDSLADISRARAIGYEPQYGVEDGLRETIRWFENES